MTLAQDQLESLVFQKSDPLSLGVEIEIQLLDKETLDLKPSSVELLKQYSGSADRVKAELFQSMLEFNTGICANAHEIHKDLRETIELVRPICERLNLRMASSGTHPFAFYSNRLLSPEKRYRELIDRNQWIARRLMIFGLHVHVGMRGGEHAIQMNNALLHYMPMLLALSASSPYWHSEDTELASSRITFFEATPTGGHPCIVNSWREFEELYAVLIRSGAITSLKDIWWDLRPSPGYGTLEIRICDGTSTLEETAALTALIHALCVSIDRELLSGARFNPPPVWLLRENKWRASRHGTEAKLIMNINGETVCVREAVEDLFKHLSSIAAELGYEPYFDFLRSLIEKGPGFMRQRQAARIFDGDLKKLAGYLADEFDQGSPIWLES